MTSTIAARLGVGDTRIVELDKERQCEARNSVSELDPFEEDDRGHISVRIRRRVHVATVPGMSALTVAPCRLASKSFAFISIFTAFGLPVAEAVCGSVRCKASSIIDSP